MFARRPSPPAPAAIQNPKAATLLDPRRLKRAQGQMPEREEGASRTPTQAATRAASSATGAAAERVAVAPREAPTPPAVTASVPATREMPGGHYQRMAKVVAESKAKVLPLLFDRIDTMRAAALSRDELAIEIDSYLEEILRETKLILSSSERRALIVVLLDEMVGYGPLQPLLHDESITEIMVNSPRQVYVERDGRIELTDVHFCDDAHVMHIGYRIANKVGRRVDESSPMCDARLPDGSRVNIIIPPLSLKGPTISIRKFAKKKLTLDRLAQMGAMNRQMVGVLKIAVRSKLNILISGGTGSGKTTLLNALSQMVEPDERIITIEDAAELQLQQPHVVSLEARAANIEGSGAVTIRDLLRNTLRMRPDRIVIGEVRGEEVIDMLQAMNTGHEGSLGTVHANSPRDALIRLENMIALAGYSLSTKAIRTQLVAALDLIVQVGRMRDGSRRITHITEVVGLEGDVILTQDLFVGAINGDGGPAGFEYTGFAPHFLPKVVSQGYEKMLNELLHLKVAPTAKAS